MKKFQKLSRIEMKNVLGGDAPIGDSGYYKCCITGSHVGDIPDPCGNCTLYSTQPICEGTVSYTAVSC